MTNVDARLILRHQPPFRFVETVTLLVDGSAHANIALLQTTPLWVAHAKRSALAVEYAAQTMGVLIRSQDARSRRIGMLAGVHSFKWNDFAVPVHSVRVVQTGSRSAFHDFKAEFYGTHATVCGEMRGTIHLTTGSDDTEIAPKDQPVQHIDQPLYDITNLRQSSQLFEMDVKTRASCPVYAGHFPGAPITPGVLIVEMMIEAAYRSLAIPSGLRSLKDLIFSSSLLPGDCATFRLRRTADFEFSAMLMRNDKRLARARLVLAALSGDPAVPS